MLVTVLLLFCAFRDAVKRGATRGHDLLDEEIICRVVVKLCCNTQAGAESVLQEEWYVCTFAPDAPEGGRPTPFRVHAWHIRVIHEACDAVYTGALYSSCGPLIWMPDLPSLPEIWTRGLVVLRGKERMRMNLTFVSGVVPFQHGSVSARHQFHMSWIQKQSTAGGAMAVWCSNLLE